jgi:GAF domain-containing protein
LVVDKFDPKFINVHRQQESLRLVIESISSELEFRPLLTLIVRHACELIGADNGTVGLVDKVRNVIRTEAVYDMPPTELGAEMPLGVGLAGQVFRDQQPLRLDCYGDVEPPLHPHLAEYAVIGVPIFWRETLVGVFGIGAAPPRRFTDQDVETLTLFARHAAIAIENARLFAATQQTLHETELLYQTSQRISMALEVKEVIDAYLEHIAAQDRYACSVVLYEFDKQGQRTTIIVQGRWTPETGLVHVEERYPYIRDTLDPWLDTGQTVTSADVHSDPRVPPQLREIQRQSNRPALALIPLMVRGQRIGLVILSYAQVHYWVEADLGPYQVTAAQLATAIDSRRQRQLLTERGQQVAILVERQLLALPRT